MATPRKHWFRVADSVLNESWTNNELAALVRLMAYLNTRWARSGLEPGEACEADIPIAAVMQITGRGRADVARRSLEYLANLTGMSVGGSSKVCSIKWPKWAEFQELRSRKCPEIARESPPPQTHTQTHTQEDQRKPVATAPVGGSAPGNGKAKREPSEEARRVFSFLSHAIQRSMPGASVPAAGTERCRRWCIELERLHTLGEPGGSAGFAWQDIRAVLEWLPTHERGDFRWGLVIRSASKFRSHFARLLAEHRQGIGETDDQRYARMARELEEERSAE